MREEIVSALEESARIKKSMAGSLPDVIAEAASAVIDAFKKGGKVLLIGNGGSAADAQHIAAEMVGRFKKERAALPALALTTDTSTITALANDYGYDSVFSRQVEALGEKKDVLIAISTSGTSPVIAKAVDTARARGLTVIVLTGKSGGGLKDKADIAIMVPSEDTPRIQEAHITVGHIICELVERGLFEQG